MTAMHRISNLLLVLPLILTVSACDTELDPANNPEALLINQLVDRNFIAQKVEQGGVPHELVPGTELTLGFYPDQWIGATAGCNSAGAEYRIEDGKLTIIELCSTEMGCGQELHQQDDWYFGILSSAPTLTLDGNTLILDNGSVHIQYLDEKVVSPDLALVGPKWVVDTIIDGDSALNADWPDPATLEFGDDSKAKVFDGCNGGEVNYELDGTELIFGSLILTDMACLDEATNQLEAAVQKVLVSQQPVSWSIDANRLDLTIDGFGLSLVADPQ